jgi:hypothetical protein
VTAPGKPAGAKIPMWAWIAAAVLLLAALRLLR